MMVLVYVPLVAPSVVLVARAMVGVEVVDHTTPLVVTVAPPLYVILPPLTAVVDPIELTVVVAAKVATACAVFKVISEPYFVPTLFVAKALM